MPIAPAMDPDVIDAMPQWGRVILAALYLAFAAAMFAGAYYKLRDN